MASADDSSDGAVSGAPAGTAAIPAGGAGDTAARIGFIGKTLGRFHIKAELGRGGMATVYRAHDPQLGRDVAVKVMHGFFAGRADIEARFRREANAVAAIRHPSILALYDFAPPVGEEPGYIVSELIEGHGLRHLVEACGGRLLPEAAALITIRVAEALGAAHAAGIVHRDVKPDNVLIDRAGGGARVVLTDFGVAHVSGLDTMTATGAVLGSPAYMSPEQARGDDVGPPSDVFSLGVLLYQLCTGHLPFSGKDPLAVITAILRGDYLRPGKVEARVGPALEQIITRCLLQDPGARLPDGGAVAAALRELLASSDLGDEGAALRSYLADPDAFGRQHAPAIARAAMTAAEIARRRGQIPRAIAELGRALAYAPDDPAARELLARLGTRGRSRWIAAGIALGVAAVAIVAGQTVMSPSPSASTSTSTSTSASTPTPTSTPPSTSTSTPTPTSPSTTTSTSASISDPTPPAPVFPPAPLPALVQAGSAPIPPTVATARPAEPTDLAPAAGSGAAARGSPAPRLRRVPRGISKTGAAANPTAANPTPIETEKKADVGPAAAPADPVPASPADKPSHDPAPAAEIAAAPATGSMVLRAKHGFCEPSLDGHPPSLRATSYNNLGPGEHKVYCTLPQGGGKVLVATYDLRPGTRPSLIIVPGPDGRPVLGRPE